MTTSISLDRSEYLGIRRAKATSIPSLDYFAAKYKNIRHLLAPDRNYTVTHLDEANAPELAFRFFGDVGYWWVICLYNGILDPISDFEPGTEIRLPRISDVNALLSAEDQSSNLTVVTL